MMKLIAKDQRGFTLIELVVVIAILGILAAVAVPMVTKYLSNARERAYDADVNTVQTAVDAYYSSPDNDKFIGKRQYPIYGTSKGSHGAGLVTTDADILTAITVDHATSPKNPEGGTTGGNPKWVDDGDGIRGVDGDTSEEVLLDTAEAVDSGWYLVAVTRHDKTYYVDTRDYIVDMKELVDKDLLDDVPDSASEDNCQSETDPTVCTGSYTYYVDSDGKVKTLLATFPESDQTGFQNVYP